ncbi:MAG: hypothetical protein H3C26_07300 [Rhodocyclaceae bacterium]|nr:hypothetical protein [Rhodocyclaceae bacterium]
MSTVRTQSYIGKGSISIARPGKPLIPIGNTSKLEFAIEEDKKELADYENTGGGIADAISRIKSVRLSLSVHKLSPENLAMALRGGLVSTAAGAVADEVHEDVQAGGLVVFAKPQDLEKSLVVTDGEEIDTVTYQEGRDYVRRRAGIVTVPVADGGTIPNESDIAVSYTALSSITVEALTNVGEEVRLVFDGVNEANGLPLLVDAFRVKPGAAKGWSLIGDDFSALEIEADVLKDDSRTGLGLSSFFSARMGGL